MDTWLGLLEAEPYLGLVGVAEYHEGLEVRPGALDLTLRVLLVDLWALGLVLVALLCLTLWVAPCCS